MTIGIDYGVIKSKFKEFGFYRYFYRFLFPVDDQAHVDTHFKRPQN